MPPVSITLSPDQLQFIQGAVSITAASADKRRIPSVCRALACQVTVDSANRQRIELLFNRSQSQQLLLDLTGSQALAAVFSEPASHRTLQIKGSEIHPGVVDDAKLSLVKTAGERFANALLELGYNKAFTLSLLSCRPAELVAVSFLPQALFEQSPGPAAGNPVVVA